MTSTDGPSKPTACALFQDPMLQPYQEIFDRRQAFIDRRRTEVLGNHASLLDLADWHRHYGLHRLPSGNWLFREWLPYATGAVLLGEFNDWNASSWFELHPVEGTEDWEIELPGPMLHHGQKYQLFVEWPGGSGWRLPSAVQCVDRERQENGHTLFNARVWDPEQPFQWRHDHYPRPRIPFIYEAHPGCAQQEPKVGTFREFRENILPRIANAGYNCLQLMAVMEHPYYGSFGYHVSSFFAASSRFGTPDELKSLIDTAHGMGLRVIMDLVHSHAVKNELEGLGCLCGHQEQFFHAGPRGEHPAWNSYCFDYSKPQVCRFLLSNCRFWLEEFHLDGFRFDGVTSMLYFDHGLGHAFTSYDDYFDANVDWDSIAYLALANELCHSLGKPVWTIAEDVSGMPGLALPIQQGGVGFDYRLAMGITDYWFKLLDRIDECWNVGELWHELNNRRHEEQTISYVECHDQAIVGGQTFLYRCLGNTMYDAMDLQQDNFIVARGIALHKLARLATAATAGGGYLNFMGNEFGHPEWIDLPRDGNGWSLDHARRRWDLRDNPALRYHHLARFDRDVVLLLRRHPNFFRQPARLLWINEEMHAFAFERDGLLFLCNFHPTRSYADLTIPAPRREYRLLLDSDAPEYSGHGRVEPGQHYFASGEGPEQAIQVYLPTRTALILE